MAEPDYSYIAEIVRRAQGGNSDAFAELYMSTYQKQFRFAYQYLRDEQLAQDALQETYIIVFKRLATLKDPSLFVSWVNQINFRVCFKMQKVKQRQDMEVSEEALTDMATSTPDPEAQIINIDEKEYVIRQIMSLPSSEAQAIILHYYKNLKINEIAEMMDVSRSTIIRYMNNGKAKLSKILRAREGMTYGK